jgi:hypothetical protein
MRDMTSALLTWSTMKTPTAASIGSSQIIGSGLQGHADEPRTTAAANPKPAAPAKKFNGPHFAQYSLALSIAIAHDSTDTHASTAHLGEIESTIRLNSSRP